MSVLIKGMDIPESCHDCRFCGWSNFWQVYDCHMAKPNALLLFNGEKTNSDSKTRNGRADNCPLVPVSDHGRLIDADAFMQPRWIDGRNEFDAGVLWTIKKLGEAPTVIPASKEGET